MTNMTTTTMEGNRIEYILCAAIWYQDVESQKYLPVNCERGVVCEGTNCPIKNECYRFAAIPSKHRQSYFQEVPYDFENKKCNHKMNIWKPEPPHNYDYPK